MSEATIIPIIAETAMNENFVIRLSTLSNIVSIIKSEKSAISELNY